MKNLKTKINYAVKGISKKFISSKKNGQGNLMSEISMLQELNHPNIVSLEEVYETENSVYLVQEVCEGGTLLGGRTDLLSSEQAQYVIKPILEVILYLSSKGITHRDLKPFNILRKYKKLDDTQNVLKVIDFGLVYDPNALVDTKKKKCGTPGYIAPEILNQSKNPGTFEKLINSGSSLEGELKLNSKIDVYSLGVIFYYMVTGVFPFEGQSSKEVYSSNKKGNINFNIPEKKMVSPKAWDLIEKMLQFDPELRISAEEALYHPFFEIQFSEFEESPDIPNEWDIPEDHEEGIRNDIPRFQSKIFNGGENLSFLTGTEGSIKSTGRQSLLLSVKMKYGRSLINSPHKSPDFSGNSPLTGPVNKGIMSKRTVLSKYAKNSPNGGGDDTPRFTHKINNKYLEDHGNSEDLKEEEDGSEGSIQMGKINYMSNGIINASGQKAKSLFSDKKL